MRRVLLDENLPRLLKRDLPQFEIRTVAEAGWAGTRSGQRLRLAEAEFDVFLTADHNLPHQQNTRALAPGFVVLSAESTKLDDPRPLIPPISEATASVEAGAAVYVPQA